MAPKLSLASSPAFLRRLIDLPPALRCCYYATASTVDAKPEIFDVVCIGGGPNGLSLLSALRSHPSTKRLKIALIDGQKLSSTSSTDEQLYSNRCSSLTPSSVKFLKSIGAWDHISRQRTQDYHGMRVWDGVSGSKITFDPLDARSRDGGGLLDAIAELVPGARFRESRRRDDISLDGGKHGVVATMCENSNLTAALSQRLDELGEVEVLDNTKVTSIELGPEPADEVFLNLSLWPIVTLPCNRKLAPRLLVGADGANSPVRNFANIPSDGWSYNQHGVVATLDLGHTFSSQDLRTAYQRFLTTGPIALLPLPNNKASLVWSITASLAPKLKTLAPSDLTNLINAAFRLQSVDLTYILNNLSTINLPDEISWRLSQTPQPPIGPIPQITSIQPHSIASFPLRLQHASTYTGHRIALIGDAAHTIHPLAGQGLNLGLADAQALAASIIYGVEHGMDIGSSWCLDGYVAERWAKNNAVMGVCDKLQKVYSVESGPVVWGRSLGLDVVNGLEVVKGFVMGAAGGR